MGQHAEMHLDGSCCEGCGTYMGEASGFPRYCSPQCAEGSGQPVRRRKTLEGRWLLIAEAIRDGATTKTQVRQALPSMAGRILNTHVDQMRTAGLIRDRAGILSLTDKALEQLPER